MATFSPFLRLPVEIQLLVWQFATPGCIFRLGWDRNTTQPAHRAILRPLAPISHACRASRESMLKGVVGGSFPSSAGLFTFYDGVTARNEGFHFLSKLDTLWVPSDFLYHGIFDRRFTLDLGVHLCHVATERHYIYDIHSTFPNLVHQYFPNLDTLTILVTNPTMFFSPNKPHGDPTSYPALVARLFPEINEEINPNFRDEDLTIMVRIEFEQARMRKVYQDMKVRYPARKIPLLKFRDLNQFSASREIVYGHGAAASGV